MQEVKPATKAPIMTLSNRFLPDPFSRAKVTMPEALAHTVRRAEIGEPNCVESVTVIPGDASADGSRCAAWA